LLLLPALAVFLLAFAEPEYHYSVSVPTEQDKIAVHDPIATTNRSAQLTLVADIITANDSFTTDSIIYTRASGNIAGNKTENAAPSEKDDKTVASVKTLLNKEIDTADDKISLVIIDGKEYYSDILKALDLYKIESVSVLKDAVATAHYGEKGKNGVIIIKTKAASDTENKTKDVDSTEKNDTIGTIITTSLAGKNGSINITDSEAQLIIVDGKEYQDALKTLKPEEIASITIFKEAKSTAVYGEKGKNGVIIIKTKAASEEAKTQDVHP
jgi:TonB-dependent SusC/RagA subfamily outer membrane receptor